MSTSRLSIIIVNYNVKYFLEQCLHSVKAATKETETQIIVVDNNSSDNSVEYLRPKFPEITIIENKENIGFAKANNQALQICDSEYILLLNPDTIIGEDIINTLCFTLDERTDVGAVGVKMIDGNGSFLPESKRAFPTPWISFCKLFGLSKIWPDSPRFAQYSLPFLDKDKIHEVEALSGAFMLLRSKTLKKVGLLDERFFMYGEDIDLSYRFVLAGYKNLYIPERILHYKGESTKKGNIKYTRHFYGAMTLFFHKYYPHSGSLMSALIRLAIFIIASLSFITRPFRMPKKTKRRKRNLLIFCEEANFDTCKKLCQSKIAGLEHINLWDLDCKRIMDSICRSNMMKSFTDYAFYYPDVRFEQILLLMDKMPESHITYHIAIKESGQLISPGK